MRHAKNCEMCSTETYSTKRVIVAVLTTASRTLLIKTVKASVVGCHMWLHTVVDACI